MTVTEATDATEATTPSPTEGPATAPVVGTVVDSTGVTLAGASVEAIVPGVGRPGTATTGPDGRFGVSTDGAPVWLRVTAPDYHDRVVAAAPGADRRIRLRERAGTVALRFGGDVMFGRRFYESPDALEPHHRIRAESLAADHARALRYVAPSFRAADVASVNLETPLTRTDWRHPEKRYTFVSAPEAAPALADAGIGYAALGNNHVFDALTPGLRDTIRALDAAGVAASGAGESSAAAWAPARIDVRGQTVGFVSCTTKVGGRYRLDWSADRDTPPTTVSGAGNDTDADTATDTDTAVDAGPDADAEETTLTVGGHVGAAEADADRLAAAVADLAATVDVVVVQIHGGEEYRRTPTAAVERQATAAAAAGADVVVCHHPHVTGGVTTRHGAVIAWSLGNLVFDQELWETFPSYLLTVYAGADGVAGAVVDPVLVEGYVPKAVVGEPRADQLWRTAGLSERRTTLGPASLRHPGTRGAPAADAGTGAGSATPTGSPPQVTTAANGSGTGTGADPSDTPIGGPAGRVDRRLRGEDRVDARESWWVADVLDGEASVTLGRDRFPTGSFENPDVDGAAHEGPLWRFGRGEGVTGPGVGRDGTGGVRLVRSAGDTERKILTPEERVPIAGPATLFGTYRFDGTAGLELLVRLYDGTGERLRESSTAVPGTAGDWRRIRRRLSPPAEATHARVYFRLSPPDDEDGPAERVARVDDLRLVEWFPAATGGREFDHLRVDGAATVRFASDVADGVGATDGPVWPTLDG